MAEDLSSAIESNAQGPAKVEGDAGSVQQHSLPDQIAADRYLAGRKTASNPRKAIRFIQLVPPGAD